MKSFPQTVMIKNNYKCDWILNFLKCWYETPESISMGNFLRIFSKGRRHSWICNRVNHSFEVQEEEKKIQWERIVDSALPFFLAYYKMKYHVPLCCLLPWWEHYSETMSQKDPFLHQQVFLRRSVELKTGKIICDSCLQCTVLLIILCLWGRLGNTIPNQLSEKEMIVLLHILIKFRCEWNSWLNFIGDLSPSFIFVFEEWSLGYAKVSISKLLAIKLWDFEFDPYHSYQKSGTVVYIYITLAFRRLTTDS